MTFPFSRSLRRVWRCLTGTLRALLLAVATPLLEKNPAKLSPVSQSLYVPMVFSMARLVILGFAAVMMRQLVLAGVAGWPEATLSIAIVLALPILNALERAKASEVLGVATTLLKQLGRGEVRRLSTLFPVEPDPRDDHRNDRSAVARRKAA